MVYFAIARRVLLVAACAVMAAPVWSGLLRAETASEIDPESILASFRKGADVVTLPSMESWVGGEGYRRVAALYSGITWAPLSNVRQDGFRLRVVAGQSLYRYSGSDYDPVAAKNFTVQFTGVGGFADVMAGWQFTSGSTTIKAFGGVAVRSNKVTPFDPSTRIRGEARGIKGALEVWHNWTSRQWTSVDLSLLSTSATSTAQIRSGWRLDNPAWSVGPEFKMVDYRDANRDVRSVILNARLGLFVRYEDFHQEITIAAGAVRELTMPSGRHMTTTPLLGYTSAQYLQRF